MALVRDPVPVSGTLAQLRAWIGRVLEQLDDWHTLYTTRVDVLVGIARAQGVTVTWFWGAGVDTSIDPGAQNIVGNSQILANVTQFAVSRTELFGRELGGRGFELIDVGDQIFISDRTKVAQQLYDVDAPPTPMNGGATVWYQVDVTATTGNSTNPNTGDAIAVQWLPPIA